MVLVRLTFGSDIQGGFKSVRLGASLNIQRLGMNMPQPTWLEMQSVVLVG